MRTIAICILFVSTTSVFAEDVTHFYPNGTAVRFTVDSSTLASTPKWRPGEAQLPLSADDAIAVAAQYHNSLSFSSFASLYRWRPAKTTLISCDDDRWYWFVTFTGVFDTKLLGKKSGGHSLECPETIYNHYPVILSGKMPKPLKLQPDDPNRPAETLRDLIEMLESDGMKFTPILNASEWPILNNGSPENDDG